MKILLFGLLMTITPTTIPVAISFTSPIPCGRNTECDVLGTVHSLNGYSGPVSIALEPMTQYLTVSPQTFTLSSDEIKTIILTVKTPNVTYTGTITVRATAGSDTIEQSFVLNVV